MFCSYCFKRSIRFFIVYIRISIRINAIFKFLFWLLLLFLFLIILQHNIFCFHLTAVFLQSFKRTRRILRQIIRNMIQRIIIIIRFFYRFWGLGKGFHFFYILCLKFLGLLKKESLNLTHSSRFTFSLSSNRFFALFVIIKTHLRTHLIRLLYRSQRLQTIPRTQLSLRIHIIKRLLQQRILPTFLHSTKTEILLLLLLLWIVLLMDAAASEFCLEGFAFLFFYV